MKILSSATTLLIAFSIVSCQKQDLSQDQTASSLAINLKASNPAVVLRMAQGLGNSAKTESVNLVWKTAKASADMLKFEAEKNGAEVEFKSKVQQTVDLFNASSNLGNISIPAGTYDEVELRVNLSPNGAVPALAMTGTLETAAGSTPVSFTANEAIEVKGEKKNVSLNGSSLQNADIPLNFSLVVKGITSAEFDNAIRTNGVIMISASDNASLYSKIVKNLRELKEESEFHR